MSCRADNYACLRVEKRGETTAEVLTCAAAGLLCDEGLQSVTQQKKTTGQTGGVPERGVSPRRVQVDLGRDFRVRARSPFACSAPTQTRDSFFKASARPLRHSSRQTAFNAHYHAVLDSPSRFRAAQHLTEEPKASTVELSSGAEQAATAPQRCGCSTGGGEEERRGVFRFGGGGDSEVRPGGRPVEGTSRAEGLYLPQRSWICRDVHIAVGS